MNIFDIDSWNEIWETINRNRKRSIMTAFGVFWGIFMLTVMVGLGLGLERSVINELGSVSTNSTAFITRRTSVPYQGFSSGRWWAFNQADIDQISRIDGIKYVTGFAWGRQMNFTYGNKKGNYSVVGYTPEYNLINPQFIPGGRYINEIDMTHRRKVGVIGKQIAEELFGTDDPVGKSVLVGNTYFMIVGVNETSGGMQFGNVRNTMIIPSSTYQQMMNLYDKMDILVITGHDHVDMKIIDKKVESLIRTNHALAPDDQRAVNVNSVADQFKIFDGLFKGIRLLTWVVGIGTLLAGIVGISNIMLIVVRERTQEIGVRRALGAKPITIISQIMAESFVLTFIAGIFGLSLGVALLSLIGSAVGENFMGGGYNPQISLGLGLTSLAIIVMGGLLAGLLPSFRAISIKPVDAIREE